MYYCVHPAACRGALVTVLIMHASCGHSLDKWSASARLNPLPRPGTPSRGAPETPAARRRARDGLFAAGLLGGTGPADPLPRGALLARGPVHDRHGGLAPRMDLGQAECRADWGSHALCLCPITVPVCGHASPIHVWPLLLRRQHPGQYAEPASSFSLPITLAFSIFIQNESALPHLPNCVLFVIVELTMELPCRVALAPTFPAAARHCTHYVHI